ncbi:hypothetical protein ACFQJD_14030 [Haloplanus sp. GCM10025708]|uniref:hypothetical protein n=1 Tax=Haloferacaceae TaxID=1644056 RepID=UPI00361D2174
MVTRPALGTALLVAGVALLAATLVGGVVFAPTSSTAPAQSGESATPLLLGVQGVGSYSADGYVARVENDSVAWRESTSGTYFDVTRLDNGSVLAAFLTGGYERCGPYESPCSRTGFRIIDPSPSPEVVSEWSFPVRSHVASEVHDVEPLPGGGFLVADMEHERVVVVEGGEVTWEWEASTRYDPPADPTKVDWLHINDVDRIGDGRYLVSVRNANQILLLERGEGVVEVINEDRDGDGVGDTDVLNHQHNPQWLGDGAVLVADSENHRVVELHRGDDGRWRPAWTLTGAGGEAFDWPRDADRLPNGHTLVTDTRNSRVLEVNETGHVFREYSMNYRHLPYEADSLPHGEPVGGVRYGVGASATGNAGLPVLTPAHRLLSAAVRVPRWFTELHLLATVLSLCLVGVGSVVRWRSADGR